MYIAKEENGELIEYPIHEGDYRLRFQNTSLPVPLAASDLAPGYVEVKDTTPPTLNHYESAMEGNPARVGGEWVRTWNIIQPDLATTISRLCAEVEALAVGKRAAVVGNVSPYEAASWAIKRAEALAHRGGKPADAPNLQAEATKRGVTLAAIVDKVITKSDAFLAAEASIAGVAGKHKDTIMAMTTVAEVQAYDITIGWV